jgi:hypothetical protein
MTEMLAAISDATAAAGHTTELVLDRFPPLRDDCVYVVIPHEFHAWGDRSAFPDHRQRARTVALCTENPGTEWFEATCQLAPELAAAVSINRSSAAELQRRGIPCEHLQLGYSPLWDAWDGDQRAERKIDVLYLGAADPRRDPLLAGLGRELWMRKCQFLVPPLEPRTRARPDFLKADEKYRRICSAKILLNLHRVTSSALEWMRFLEAICNGCVVVSEPCVDNEPLIAGKHFVEADADSIGGVTARLLDDPERLRRLRHGAYDFVRQELPRRLAAERLVELARTLPRDPPRAEGSLFSRDSQLAPVDEPKHRIGRSALEVANKSGPSDSTSQRDGSGNLAARLSNRLLAKARGSLRTRTITQTPAYRRATPRVSVLCVVGDQREESIVALKSVADSQYPKLELLIAETGSAPAANQRRRFLDEHRTLAGIQVREQRDRGLAQSRNTLARRARGEHLFILDGEGGVYPSALERLVSALDGAPDAFFAYTMVGLFDGGEPVALSSSLPWEPDRLRRGNWIDAMLLIRRERLLDLGGYTTDPSIAGCEDFDLLCKCAEAGGLGVQVPEVLAWRRAPVEADVSEKWGVMRERFPYLLGGV